MKSYTDIEQSKKLTDVTDENMMVVIPVEEYEHLKECKARLMEIQERRIAELSGQIAEMKMKTAINNAIPTLNTIITF